MKIRYLRKQGNDRPAVICDVCEKVITDVAKANVLWKMAGSDEVIVCHMGKCDDNSQGARTQIYPWASERLEDCLKSLTKKAPRLSKK